MKIECHIFILTLIHRFNAFCDRDTDSNESLLVMEFDFIPIIIGIVSFSTVHDGTDALYDWNTGN